MNASPESHRLRQSNAEKVALVTGASGGIGTGVVIALAEAGWNVGINYFTNPERANSLVERVRALGRRTVAVEADVGNGQAVTAMFAAVAERLGVPGLLVNNAGIQDWAPLTEVQHTEWERVIRTNLTGTFLCIQGAARAMARGGRIINIGSGANRVPFPGLCSYCASKGGVEMLTAAAAVELGPRGISVNCIAPGAIEIERTRAEDPRYAELWGNITPLRRVGTAQDVADAVVFLGGPGASFISGQTIYVDGGLWRQGRWPYPGADQ